MTEKLGAAWAVDWIKRSAAAIHENRQELIDLDRAIGDGDHGDNMNRGFETLLSKMEGKEFATIADVMKLTASTLISTVGGASGPLYGTAFMRAAKASGEDLDANGVVGLIQAALQGILDRGKATTGEKTMVDTWTPALEAAKKAAESTSDCAAVLRASATAAAEGAESTIPMQATKGRASYLGERSIGHLDPGSRSTTLILNAAAEAAEAL